MKKYLSILLSVAIIFSCFSGSIVSVSAITDYTTGETEDGIGYSVDNETNELTVTYADFSTTDLIIPAYIDGRPVTAIGANFLNDTPNPNLRSVVIPDTVTTIGFYAFGNCINLTSVVMSENIEYVKDYAFFNTALSNNRDTWENGALYIGKFLFGVSTDYSGEFVVKDGTRVIGMNCFCSTSSGKGCENITNIVLPDTLISVGVFAFSNCKGLTSINIPDSVKYIGNVAFSGCTNLSSINVNTSVLTYVGQNILAETSFYYDEVNWQDDVLYLNTAALCGRNNITDLKIKEGTEIIADYAFGCNFGISSVSLPSSLKIICDLAFDDLHSLPSIKLPDGLEYIAANAFDGCDLLTELDIPSSVSYIGLFAFNRTDNLEKLIIRNPNCTIIDNHEEYTGGAYSISTNTTVYGYEGSTAESFANNNGVNFVTLFSESGTGGSSYGEYNWTFDSVSGILSISGRGKIPEYSYGNAPWFSFRDSIKVVVADSDIYSIGANAFTDCNSLEEVKMPGVYEVGDYAFDGCESLKDVELSSNYTVNSIIGKYAFAFCPSLTKICLPFQNSTISEKAFYCCEKLNTVAIYTSAKIESNAFSYCPNISSIYMINNGLPLQGTISENAFSGVKADVYYNYSYPNHYSLKQTNRFGGEFNYISMSAGVVGYDAYWDYDQQNEILTISGKGGLFRYSSGNDLPWIDFASQTTCAISSIVIEDGITEIPAYSFEYMTNVTTVTLPNTLLRLEPIAFRVCESLTEITLPASLEYVDGGNTKYWYRCPNLNDVYYVGTEQEWNEIYDLSNNNNSERITPHFLVYHPATQSCNQAGYPAHYEFDGTTNNTFYDLNKVEILNPEPKVLEHSFSGKWNKDENSHWHTCLLCGTAISNKANHVFDNSCDKICNTCGYIRTTEHKYTKSVTPPTYTERGYTTYTCENCGDTYIDDYVDMLEPTTAEPTTEEPTTCEPTTEEPTEEPTTVEPTTEPCELVISSTSNIFANDTQTVSLIGDGYVTVNYVLNEGVKLDSFQWELNYDVDKLQFISLSSANYNNDIVLNFDYGKIRATASNAFNPFSYDDGDSFVKVVFKAIGCGETHEDEEPTTEPYTDEPTEEPTTAEPTSSIICGTTGDCTWTLDDEGTLTISGNGEMGAYSPWGRDIKKVIIENGVTSIGYRAFYNCTNLTSVTIPDSVTDVDYAAFSCCTNLASITIPDSVTSIGEDAFTGCTSLTRVTIPSSVTTIGDCVFAGCTSLTNVIIDSKGSFGSNAFSGCTSLKSVTISDNVTSIYSGAFGGCTSLTNITIGNNVRSIGENAFEECTSLKSITIPDSVTSIGNRAFWRCTSLTTIYGYKGSKAERYANDNGYKFIDISEPTTAEPTTIEPTTAEPTTEEPEETTFEPTTIEPTTAEPTTEEPEETTFEPTTVIDWLDVKGVSNYSPSVNVTMNSYSGSDTATIVFTAVETLDVSCFNFGLNYDKNKLELISASYFTDDMVINNDSTDYCMTGNVANSENTYHITKGQALASLTFKQRGYDETTVDFRVINLGIKTAYDEQFRVLDGVLQPICLHKSVSVQKGYPADCVNNGLTDYIY